MRTCALLISLLAATCLADPNPNINPSVPSSYTGQTIQNTKITNWFAKAGTNDIVMQISDYPMGFLIPATDKTMQTAFLMAAQSGSSVSFYVESVVASQWWVTGWYGRIDNFSFQF